MNAMKPIFHQVIAELRQRREADAAEKEEARRAATAARRPLVTKAGSSPIERFNAENRIADLMLRYGYEPAPSGLDWRSPLQQSGSYASRIYLRDDGSEEFISLSGSDAAAGVGVKTSSGARRGDAFDLYMFHEHSGDRHAALSAWDEEEAKRRQAQREENAQIGVGKDFIPHTQTLSVDQILARFVFIRDGSQVADLDCPQGVLTLLDFRNALAGSKHHTVNANGCSTLTAATKVWLESPDRLQAATLTFHAGAGLMTICPNGRQALNIWRPKMPANVPENWQWLAVAFVNHVTALWGADTEVFLDWLAHIIQKPGELPHFGWLHTSRLHGTGRNWIASVLVRLLTGNVAASLDLVGLLDGGFNDRLSQCLLAIVDEVNEGGGQKHRTANRLRQLVTAEVREINPKYGRKRMEHNAARWLIFSNHTGALPLDEHDRRFWVVSHDAQPERPSYYVRLYKRLKDPAFIASVDQFLRQRDISAFNPGQRPPMNAAKSALVEFSQSEDDAICNAIVSRWPVDLITKSELEVELPVGSKVVFPGTRYSMDRAGIKRLNRKVRHSTKPQTIYAVRNHPIWNAATADQIRAEIDRAPKDEKTSAMEGGDEA
jgi:hypothetical protein